MSDTLVRPMAAEDEYYVATCSHVDESAETDACAEQRLRWFREHHASGVRVLTALANGKRAGFLYLMPIGECPWGPLGSDLTVVPCLYVEQWATGRGLGRALLAAAESEARAQGSMGLVVPTVDWDFWFMPTSYFQRLGYVVAASRDKHVLLWKTYDAGASPPVPLRPNYRYQPVPGAVVVDLFWHTFCQTSVVEAHRVREVVAEFGDAVVLHEHCADDRNTLLHYQIPRAIYVNGREASWGYEAPREGIREAITSAMQRG